MVKIKRFLALIICLIILVVFFSGCNESPSNNSNQSKTLLVDDDPGKDFTSIQSAINAAKAGDTIFVYDGFYDEALTINKPINLVGSGAINTFILPKDVKSNNNCTIIVNVDNCIIKDFDISFEGEKSENIGIKVSSSNNTILNNSFSNFKYGIYFFNESADYFMCNNNISCNKIFDCSYGIYGYSDMKNNVFFNNSIKNNQDGIEFYFAVNNSIIANEISSNLMYGIFISTDSDGNIISHNYLKDNYYGIRFKGVSFNEIFLNRIVECDVGLYSCCGSKYNILYNNSLIHNIKQAADSFTNSWDNGVFGNYWDDYSQKYPNATHVDGVWDTPYNILDGNNKDNFPLIDPFI
jgi:parallel beta-helix repeat protein